MSSNNTTLNPDLPKYKLIFLGDQNVGKSCILYRFSTDTFVEEYQATIGLDFQNKIIRIDNQDINLLLYDTAGQERFRSLIPMYTRDTNIILLVYDISCKDSFLHIPDWLNQLTNVKKEEVIFALIGNKNDLNDKREVTFEEGEKFAKENDFLFHEVSAKTSDGFDDFFYNHLVQKMKIKFMSGGGQIPAAVPQDIKLEQEQIVEKKEKKGGCC